MSVASDAVEPRAAGACPLLSAWAMTVPQHFFLHSALPSRCLADSVTPRARLQRVTLQIFLQRLCYMSQRRLASAAYRSGGYPCPGCVLVFRRVDLPYYSVCESALPSSLVITTRLGSQQSTLVALICLRFPVDVSAVLLGNAGRSGC